MPISKIARRGRTLVRRSLVPVRLGGTLPGFRPHLCLLFHAREDQYSRLSSENLFLALERAARDEEARLARWEKRYARLTPREREVLPHIVEGKLNKQTASDLGTKSITVQVHRGRIMRKMQAASFAELVRMADRLGLHLHQPRRYIKT